MIRNKVFFYCLVLSVATQSILVMDTNTVVGKAPASEDTSVEIKQSVQLEQPLTEEDFIHQIWVNREPCPGAVIDPNTGEEIITEPEVYQKALEKEKNKLNWNTTYETVGSEPEYKFKLFSWETLISGIIGAFILFTSISICQLNDYYKKKK